jgi:chromosome segregation ATPase
MISSASERETLLLAQQSQFDAEISALRLQISDLKAASHPGASVWSDYQEKSALELALEEESKSLRTQLESQLSDFQSIMDAKDHIIQQLTDQVKKLQQQVDDAQAVNQVNSNTITSQSSIIGNLQSQVDQFSAQIAAAPPAVRRPSLPSPQPQQQ